MKPFMKLNQEPWNNRKSFTTVLMPIMFDLLVKCSVFLDLVPVHTNMDCNQVGLLIWNSETTSSIPQSGRSASSTSGRGGMDW